MKTLIVEDDFTSCLHLRLRPVGTKIPNSALSQKITYVKTVYCIMLMLGDARKQ